MITVDGHYACNVPDCTSTVTSFKLATYDLNFERQASVPITVNAPPPPPPIDTGNSLGVYVLGVLEERVAVASYWSATSRGGPTVVSTYSLDGTLERTWTVEGKVYDSVVSSDMSRMVLAVGGSAGACNSGAAPILIDPTQPTPMPLASLEWTHDSVYFADDIWWNGAEVVVRGDFLDPIGSRGNGCIYARDLRRFDLTGQAATVEVRRLTQYRLVGPTCDLALLARTKGPGTSGYGLPTQVYVVNDGKTRKLGDYDETLWSAPRPARCEDLPGLPKAQ